MPSTDTPAQASDLYLRGPIATFVITEVLRDNFRDIADVLDLARRFGIFDDMPQGGTLNVTCDAFAVELLRREGGIGLPFFEELYQRARADSWPRIRATTQKIAGIELPEQRPVRDGYGPLAELRIEFDAPSLTMMEGKALLDRLEGLFEAPQIRTLRIDDSGDSVHAFLCLPASAARELRKQGPRGLSRATHLPVRRVVEVGSLAVLAASMSSWWLREHGGWVALALAPAVLAAMTLTRPTSPTGDCTAAPDDGSTRAPGLLDARSYQAQPTERQVTDPGCPERPQLAACRSELAAARPAGAQQAAPGDDAERVAADLKLCDAARRATTDQLAQCTATGEQQAAQLGVLQLLGPGKRCRLPTGWSSLSATVDTPPKCDGQSCIMTLQSGQRLTWDPAQVTVPAADLAATVPICVEGKQEKREFRVHRLITPTPK